MTEGEWMGDRWSMMLSLKKKKEEEEEENVSLSLIHIFSFSFVYCQKKKKRREEKREKGKERSKSYPLHLKQINLISSPIFLLRLYYTYIYISIQKKGDEKVDSVRQKGISVLFFVFYFRILLYT
mgnify:CR=1 FL=1